MQNCKSQEQICKCQPFLDPPKVYLMVQSSKTNIPTTMVCPILSVTVQSFNRNIWCVQQKLNLTMMRRKYFVLLSSRKILISTQWLILNSRRLKILLPLYLINCDFGPFYILLPMAIVKVERLLKYHYVYIKMQKPLAMY